MKHDFNRVPQSLKELHQWVVWRNVARDDKPTKVPFSVTGGEAKSNDPQTWGGFDVAVKKFNNGGFDGIGFMFSADDDFVGIDLDGCRDPQTGAYADWAREIIVKLNSYAEVSPSGTGVKIFASGSCPFASGKKIKLQGVELVGGKAPAIEIYDKGRYFAVTGLRLKGMPAEPQACQEAIEWLKAKFAPDEPRRVEADFRSDVAVLERAKKYLAKLPPAVSGYDGHDRLFHAACVLVLGFELPLPDARALLWNEYNPLCQPPWSEKEVDHKISQADKQTGPRGYLRNAATANWSRIQVPNYRPPAPEPTVTTLVDATRHYIESIKKGETTLVGTSIPDLDYALGGGVEYGEMIVFAARPSHGKSAVALQAIHHWTGEGLPSVIVSEEMSALMLGKRTMQFVSELPQGLWKSHVANLEIDLEQYRKRHKSCFIVESCGTAEAAAEAIERRVQSDGVRCAAIDYAQLLRAPGKNRYEQVTNTSIILRQLANRTKIVLLVLCQLNRAVESRSGDFAPLMSDIRESGQLEQDADVIVFPYWPWRFDQSRPFNEYRFIISKNRNRQTNDYAITCKFLPDRQMVQDAPPAMLDKIAQQWRDEIPD